MINLDLTLSYMVDDAANGDWESARDRAALVREGIAKLRARIDELGGYHDDI